MHLLSLESLLISGVVILPLLFTRDELSTTKFSQKIHPTFRNFVLTEPRPCEHGGGLPVHLLRPLLLLDEHLVPPDSVLVVGGEAGEDKDEDRGRTGEGGTHWGQRTGGTLWV